jgi:receptor protein-tyrosine kinase/non-specific protein-tyrosine kinase
MSRIEKALEKAARQRQGERYQLGEEGFLRAGLTDVPRFERIGSPYLITARDPDDPISEEYRKLKSLVVKLTKKRDFHNSLMVTSAVADEGKSITALNLAIMLAQEYDHTVLLVDADLRKPSIHEYLDVRPKIGLSDCLKKGSNIGDALINTGFGKLSILPAGSEVPNPFEVISSNKMKTLMRELKSRYTDRYIIFDTPPVMPYAEALSIGSVVDGVIFVVRERRVSLNNLKEALKVLKDAKVLGVVYNDASIDRFDSSYYYYSNRSLYRQMADK